MCDIFVLSEEFDYVIYQHRYQFRYAVQCTQNEEFRLLRICISIIQFFDIDYLYFH